MGEAGTSLVSTELAQALSIVDLKDGKIVGQIPTGAKKSHVFVRTRDGRKIYTVNLHDGSISVLDVMTHRLVKVIQVSGPVNRIALSSGGKWLLVGEDLGTNGKLEALDVRDFTVKHSFKVDRLPFGLKILGGEAFAACYLSGNLEVLDLTAWTMGPPIMNVAHGDGLAVWKGVR